MLRKALLSIFMALASLLAWCSVSEPPRDGTITITEPEAR